MFLHVVFVAKLGNLCSVVHSLSLPPFTKLYCMQISLQPSSHVVASSGPVRNSGSWMNKNLATAGRFFTFKGMWQRAEACFTFLSVSLHLNDKNITAKCVHMARAGFISFSFKHERTNLTLSLGLYFLCGCFYLMLILKE